MLNHFDLSASGWDTPIRIERSKKIADIIVPRIKHLKNPKGLEFGAGTGLLSFALYSYFQSILLVDNSVEMINVAKSKIDSFQNSNLSTVLIDFENENLKDMCFDVIFSQMALHHIQNIENLFQKFFGLLNDNGMLIIADLYKEDGSFHTNSNSFVHKGFDPDNLSQILSKVGFSKTEHFQCLEIEKENSKKYPVFILFSNK